VVTGDVTISVAGVDPVYCGLNAVLTEVVRALASEGEEPHLEAYWVGSSFGCVAQLVQRNDTLRPPHRSFRPLGTLLVHVMTHLGSREIDAELARDLTELAESRPPRIDVDSRGW